MQRMQGRWCGCGGAVWSPANANPLALRRSSRFWQFLQCWVWDSTGGWCPGQTLLLGWGCLGELFFPSSLTGGGIGNWSQKASLLGDKG